MYLSSHIQVSGEDRQPVPEVRVMSTSLKECLLGEGCFFSKALSSAKRFKKNMIVINEPVTILLTFLSASLPPSC